MRSLPGWIVLVALASSPLYAQESYKAEVLKSAPPASIAPEIAAVLQPGGFRILDDQGKPFAEIWLRKAIPAKSKPAGANGVIQFPFLQESELLGVINLTGEAHDYRDQTITKGLYTMRYGLQPVNGDHLGVSPFRDYALLLPTGKDKTLAVLPRKQLESLSSETAGSAHPAVFFMLAVPSSGPAAPAMIRDEEKNTWRVVVPLELEVKGEPNKATLPVSIIVVGASEGA